MNRLDSEKMTVVITNPAKMDQRAVIHFYTVEECRSANSHQRMLTMYDEKCLSKTSVGLDSLISGRTTVSE